MYDIWHDDDGVWRQIGPQTYGPFKTEREAEDLWLVPFEEIKSSYRLALESAHVAAATIEEVETTVTDYAVNYLGED